MGSVRKASAWLGLVDDNDDERYYDDDYSEGTDSGDAWVTDPRVKVASDTAEEKGRRIGTVTPDSSGRAGDRRTVPRGRAGHHEPHGHGGRRRQARRRLRGR